MADISDYLKKILSAVYGKDVRQAIRDAIYQCYKDGKSGAIDLIARERIDNLVAQSTSTDGNSELIDIRVGADGKTRTTAGQAVREQFEKVTDDISAMPDNIINAHVWEKFSDSQTITTGETITLALGSKVYGNYYSWNINIAYGSNIGNLEGKIVVGSPKNTISITSAANNISLSPFDNLKGKYALVNGTCYMIPETSEFSLKEVNDVSGTHLMKVIASEAQKVESVKYEESYGYVSSSDETLYPNVGLSGYYRYEYKGTIGQAIFKN